MMRSTIDLNKHALMDPCKVEPKEPAIYSYRQLRDRRSNPEALTNLEKVDLESRLGELHLVRQCFEHSVEHSGAVSSLLTCSPAHVP